jgi:hypothetical protein
MEPKQRNITPVSKYMLPTPAMLDNLINKCEESITEQKIKQEEIAEELAEKKEAYMVVQRKHDEAQAIIDADNEAMIILIGMKTGKRNVEEVKQFKSHSNVTHAKHKTRKATNVPWLKLYILALSEAKKFMTMQEVYDRIIAKHPECAFKSADDKKKFLKYAMTKKIITKATPKYAELAFFNDKIGLSRWLNSDGNSVKNEYLSYYINQGR